MAETAPDVGEHEGRIPSFVTDAYGFFGVLYSASFCNGFQTVS
jgi:hypothetical protein